MLPSFLQCAFFRQSLDPSVRVAAVFMGGKRDEIHVQNSNLHKLAKLKDINMLLAEHRNCIRTIKSG